MKSYEEIYEIVKQKLPEKRFYHSICVVERAEELAKIYNENVENVKRIAICHDIAKYLSKQQQQQIIKKYEIELDQMEEKNSALSHSKIGAVIAENEFGFSKEMCSAISYHTTGKENMTLLEKIIFVADSTGRDRNYEKTSQIYEMSKIDLDKAVIMCIKETLKHIMNNDEFIHLNTIKAYNYLIKRSKQN